MELKWSISFLLAFLGFLLIEHVFTIKPDVISGNGNLGILVIVLFLPVFLLSYFFTFKQARVHTKNETNKMKNVRFLLVSMVCIVFLATEMRQYASELVTALGGTPSEPDSKIYRFSWFNQYTNSMYFNVFTFLFTHILIAMAGVLSAMFKSQKPSLPK